MCGIAVVVDCDCVPDMPDWPFWCGSRPQSPAADAQAPTIPHLLPALQRRGPDATVTHTERLAGGATLSFAATTLSLSGPSPDSVRFDPAPGLQSHSSTLLLFNGEVYDGLPSSPAANRDKTARHGVGETTSSDTVRLHEALAAALDAGEDPLALLDSLRGPWSLIAWHAPSMRLFFGRDVLGRRSLLLNRPRDGRRLVLTSAPPLPPGDDAPAAPAFAELPPVGLAFLDFQADAGAPSLHLLARPRVNVLPPRAANAPSDRLVSGSQPSMYVSFLPKAWLRAQRRRATTGRANACEFARAADARAATAQGLLDALRRAVQRRVQIGGACGARYNGGGGGTADGDSSRLSLLFSGGVDSCVLGALLGETLPAGETLHLVNVAFGDDAGAIARCADRAAALSAAAELRVLLAARRDVRLHCVDVGAARGRQALGEHVAPLASPCDRPMDATIGATVWFGARGAPGRVVVSGCGADELLGGYKGRHRSAFTRRNGCIERDNDGENDDDDDDEDDDDDDEGLAAELDADIARLWFRNLGRDDRLVADCGRELRLPFLDEDVVSFVTGRRVRDVCDLSLADGVGDKRALRDVARLLGLSEAIAGRPKRAMQFGSRSRHVLEGK